jgi:hypothetical protein
MTCRCADLPSCLNYGESEKEFVRWFELVAERDWQRLYRCRHCKIFWQLDVGDRSDFAIKAVPPDQWPHFDDKPFRRDFFIRFHGGEDDEKCTWTRCNNRVLHNMAICVDHAYPEFAPEHAEP